jgi:hypothetical protein
VKSLIETFPNPLSTDQYRRVQSALFDTRRLLNKELRYPTDLQNAEYLTYLKSHEGQLMDLLNRERTES